MGSQYHHHRHHHVFTSATGVASSFDAELTTFFPFDPFRLPRSGVFIENIYREWTSVALDDSEDEDDDDDDSEEEEEDVGSSEDKEEEEGLVGRKIAGSLRRSGDDLRMHGPASLIDGETELGASFGGMSISPARPTELMV